MMTGLSRQISQKGLSGVIEEVKRITDIRQPEIQTKTVVVSLQSKLYLYFYTTTRGIYVINEGLWVSYFGGRV